MARSRAKKTTELADTSFNPAEFDPAMQTDAIVHGPGGSMRADQEHAAAHAPAGNGHAAAVERKQYTPAPNPHSIEGIKLGNGYAHLLKELPDHKKGFPGAWVVRFDVPPNDMLDAEGQKYSKERPNPVLAYLKSEGFNWGFSDGDNKGGHGKLWDEGHYTFEEHMSARQVLKKAAEMTGAAIDSGRIPD